MSSNLRNYTKALYGMDAVVQRVPDDAWENPSPCEGWTARDVVGHQAGVVNALAHMAAGNEMIPPTPPEDVSNPRQVWASARDGILTALDQPGALHHKGTYWFGPMSIDQLIGVAQWDPMTHSWDLARAAGIDVAIDEGLAQLSFDRISSMREALAKRNLIGDEVPVAADADIVSRYLGLVGRNPAT